MTLVLQNTTFPVFDTIFDDISNTNEQINDYEGLFANKNLHDLLVFARREFPEEEWDSVDIDVRLKQHMHNLMELKSTLVTMLGLLLKINLKRNKHKQDLLKETERVLTDVSRINHNVFQTRVQDIVTKQCKEEKDHIEAALSKSKLQARYLRDVIRLQYGQFDTLTTKAKVLLCQNVERMLDSATECFEVSDKSLQLSKTDLHNLQEECECEIKQKLQKKLQERAHSCMSNMRENVYAVNKVVTRITQDMKALADLKKTIENITKTNVPTVHLVSQGIRYEEISSDEDEEDDLEYQTYTKRKLETIDTIKELPMFNKKRRTEDQDEFMTKIDDAFFEKTPSKLQCKPVPEIKEGVRCWAHYPRKYGGFSFWPVMVNKSVGKKWKCSDIHPLHSNFTEYAEFELKPFFSTLHHWKHVWNTDGKNANERQKREWQKCVEKLVDDTLLAYNKSEFFTDTYAGEWSEHMQRGVEYLTRVFNL